MSPLKIELPYGKSKLTLEVPESMFSEILLPKKKEGVKNPISEVEKSIRNPVPTEFSPLDELINGSGKTSIVVNDITRSTPTHLMLPPILRVLKECGVQRDDIRIIIATGTHRPVTREEMNKILGDIAGKYKVLNHNCDDELVYLGETSFNTPVYLNETFMESEYKILTGEVELHYFAGYSGGRKSVLPGVSGRETITRNHSMLLDPRSDIGVLDGNPVHEDMTEAAEMAEITFTVNIVKNEKKEIVSVFSGDFKEVLRRGAKVVDQMYKVKAKEKVDTVLVSAGGFPRDINVYQAQKAVFNAEKMVKRGGTIILFAQCKEGVGNKVFEEWMRECNDLKDAEERVKEKFVIGGHKAYYWFRTVENYRLIMVTDLPKEIVEDMFRCEKMSPEHAVKEIDGEFSVLPYGGDTLPIV
ncbi:MAG TPA: nickel-dependent lactate racemase [Euryarchaeota archaeon]|nr:MAG: nickel-dependent lactate racemase [Thermococci archaeon]RLF97186.1 MAG: nickel-dependent lactate racemase [Thermococci archaeon]HDI10485.1 nickel-dependent lactate racemase [Euryarchaeota archaeon]